MVEQEGQPAEKSSDQQKAWKQLFTEYAEAYKKVALRRTRIPEETAILLEDLLIQMCFQFQPESFQRNEGEPQFVQTPTERIFKAFNPDQIDFVITQLNWKQITEGQIKEIVESEQREKRRRSYTTPPPYDNLLNEKITKIDYPKRTKSFI